MGANRAVTWEPRRRAGRWNWKLGLRDWGELRAVVESLEAVLCRQAERRGSADQIDSDERLNMALQQCLIVFETCKFEVKDGVVK